MAGIDFKNAIAYGKQVGGGGDIPSTKLTPQEKENWNKFIQFVADQKMTGHPDLDRRDKSVGMGLLQHFNQVYPNAKLDPAIIPRVQKELQDYRTNLIGQWKGGKIQTDAKDESEIMPNLSPIDGWPGTRTLSHRFPVATATNSDKSVTNFGTNTDAFDKAQGIK